MEPNHLLPIGVLSERTNMNIETILGFSLDEVRLHLRLAERRSACAEVKSITERHIADIRQKVKERKPLELALSAMVTQCPGDETSDYPILDALAH